MGPRLIAKKISVPQHLPSNVTEKAKQYAKVSSGHDHENSKANKYSSPSHCGIGGKEIGQQRGGSRFFESEFLTWGIFVVYTTTLLIKDN